MAEIDVSLNPTPQRQLAEGLAHFKLGRHERGEESSARLCHQLPACRLTSLGEREWLLKAIVHCLSTCESTAKSTWA